MASSNEESPEIANRFTLQQNYPNPFDGSGLSSGIYVYKLQTETQTYVRKMVLTK